MVLPVVAKKMYPSDLKQETEGNISALSDMKWLKTKTQGDFVFDI